MIEEYFFPDSDQLLAALVPDCTQILTTATTAKPRASLLVSGGNSPKPLYNQLSHQSLAWAAIDVALVDERWVAPKEPGSNESFIKANLLQHHAAAANFIAMKNAAVSAQLGYAECEAAYQQLTSPFDLTILGMGPDGHTASLFPHASGLTAALDNNQLALCSVIEANQSEVTGLLTERMTLSLAGILRSKQLILLITGEHKLKVYKDAITQSDVLATPISAVLQQTKVPLKVYWAP